MADWSLKMEERKEEYSYIIDRIDAAKHTSNKRRYLIKGLAIAATCGVLVAGACIMNQLKPWTVFSMEDVAETVETEKISEKEVTEESDDENIINLHTEEDKAALAASVPVIKPFST